MPVLTSSSSASRGTGSPQPGSLLWSSRFSFRVVDSGCSGMGASMNGDVGGCTRSDPLPSGPKPVGPISGTTSGVVDSGVHACHLRQSVGRQLMDQQRVLQHILRWAAENENIRVVVLTGSMARGSEYVHPLSDLDVELYVADEAALLADNDWYAPFGEVLVVEALPNPGWHPTRLVYYVDGKIDFMIGTVSALATTRYERPFQVLLDKDGIATQLAAATAQSVASAPPSDAAFAECTHWFYAAAIMIAKCIVRDEPWQAKQRDWDLKQQLMRMIEWDHKARYGWAYDTWSRGKRLKEWLDKDLLTDLDACWAGFGGVDNARALLSNVDLFGRIMMRTADALGRAPFDATRTRAEIVRILGGMTEEGAIGVTRSQLIVLVSGQPASGKTTLAGHLARRLSFPLVSRDTITEALADATGRRSRELSQLSFGVFWRLVGQQAATGLGVVAETNLHRGASEPGVLALAAQASVALVHCVTSREVSVQRFARRHQQGQRHWCFEDGNRVKQLRAGAADPAWDRAQPLVLGLPTMLVDTTDGYVPDLDAVVEFLEEARNPSVSTGSGG